jgi:sortase A
LGALLLGIGCFAWAAYGIWAQSDAQLEVAAAVRAPSVEPSPSPVPIAPEPVLYPEHPAKGDKIGSLEIPALKRTLPVIEGTGAKELERGVGHYAGSVLPGEEDNCVLSGHRDTVFRQLYKVKIGDSLIVQTSAGTFTYEVKRKRIVHADDKTVIVPTDHAVLTLTTCYPFNYIGSAPDRYVISADLLSRD